MPNHKFFHAFIASLRLSGLRFINTRNNEHNRRFRAVATYMQQEVLEDQDWPLFIPSPFSGSFREFEEALFGTSALLRWCWNGVAIDRSVEYSAVILNEHTKPERDIFHKLALLFKEAEIE